MEKNLIQKYFVPGPRYTSYPTVPHWDEPSFSDAGWRQSIARALSESEERQGISLYIHLPFCESLCTFCGCFKRITKNHSVEELYVRALLKEWRLYCTLLGEKPLVSSLHLGGGTPTFFASRNLQDLINGIFSLALPAADCDMSFEGHPNNTTPDHLAKLHQLGFRRVSFGVQDYSERVQKAINRIQPFDLVSTVTEEARNTGFTSVGHDLVFGLPFQTRQDIVDTIKKTMAIRPDRIAFYSYAHVPWMKGNGQRGFREEDLPDAAAKLELYNTGKLLLIQNGYREVGMDHFALSEDALHKAAANGELHRNFMGYTEIRSRLLIGLGVSAISDSWYGFSQNTKNFDDYYQMLEWDALPIAKGHLLSAEDLVIRRHILNLMCRFQTSWSDEEDYFDQIGEVLSSLSEMQEDGLLVISPNRLRITEKGRPFVRNACMAFDLRLKASRPENRLFSMTI